METNTGSVNATFTVSLTPASGQTVSVGYSTQNGSATSPADFTGTGGSLVFTPGQTTRTFDVQVNGDLLDEIDESFTVHLSSPVNATIADDTGLGTITDNDALPALAIDNVTVPVEGNSGTVNATFSVTLNTPSGRAVSVDYATADSSATAPADYAAAAGTLTFAAGETTKTITTTVNGDLLDEINEQFVVNLSNPFNATFSDSVGVATITDDDPLPALSIGDATVTEGDSGTVNATFTVTLAPVSGRDVFVQYATADGSATAGADYAAIASTTLTFLAGETTKTITVPVNGDLLDEFDENFTVNLSGPVAATITDNVGQGTITDNDALPQLAVDDVTVTEGNSGSLDANFTVSLTPVSGRPVTVQYATSNGSATAPADYTAASGSLTFTAGQTTKTVSVPVHGDLLDEIDEVFNLNLSVPTNATIADGAGLGTITDDDALPALAVNDITISEVDSGSANANFTVTLSAPSGRPVLVDYATADDTATAPADYVATGGTLTFTPGQIAKTVTVPVNGDLLDEANETYFLNLSGAVDATVTDAQGLGTITDDDPLPALAVDNVSVTEGDAGTVDATFTVSLNAPSGRAVNVDYATANGNATAGADYTAAAGTLVFAAGETTKTVTVTVAGDLLDEADETFTLGLANALNATIADASGLGTIIDNDPLASLSVNDVTVTEGDSGTVNATFTVALTPVSGRQVTVQYATADGSAHAPGDYAAATGTLTFAAGETTKTVSVAVNGDLLDEVDESFTLNLSSAGSATIADAQGVGTITDDDGTPSLSVNDVTVTEGNGSSVNAVFTVSLSSASGQSVSVDYATADGSAIAGADYLAACRKPRLHPGTDDADDHRHGQRRRTRRDRRDLHARTDERLERHDRGQPRPRDDP